MGVGQPVLLAVTGDEHVGSTVGLMPPEFINHDGETIQQSRPQRWLWQCWTDYWYWIQLNADKLGARIWWVDMGDLFEGNHHGSTQIALLNGGDMLRAAREVIAVPLALPIEKQFRVIGTEAHVGGGGGLEESISDEYDMEKDPEHTYRSCWWHLRFECAGVNIDCKHHGRRGSRPWTEGSAINNLAAEIGARHVRRSWVPDLALRAHVHIHKDSYDNCAVRAITTPAWQLKTAFIHRIGSEGVSDIGGLAVYCEDGGYDVRAKKFNAEEQEAGIWREQIA